MMLVQENISLRKLNTFGIDVSARYFASFNIVDELSELLHSPFLSDHSPLILGGGSNILFTKSFDGLVLKNDITGIKTIKEDEHYVYVQVGAGENWHRFVPRAVEPHAHGEGLVALLLTERRELFLDEDHRRRRRA